jgi:hypothetical protein
MLRRLATTIADAIEFFLNIPNWLDDMPVSKEFEQKMLKPELSRPSNRPPRG